jgi:hypothetical protein
LLESSINSNHDRARSICWLYLHSLEAKPLI